jgi:hypothetical protein
MPFFVANSPTYATWLLTFIFLQTISAAIIIYVNIFNIEQPLSSAGPPGLILRNGHFVVRPKAQYPPLDLCGQAPHMQHPPSKCVPGYLPFEYVHTYSVASYISIFNSKFIITGIALLKREIQKGGRTNTVPHI